MSRKKRHNKTTNSSRRADALEVGPATVSSVSSQSEENPESTFAIVGIGASAGGLDAFQQFLRATRDGGGMAFVFIQHLDPTHESLTPALLSRHTDMVVQEARNDTLVERNHIYVIPPNKYLSITGQKLYLKAPEEPRGFRVPIDYFFRSLAEDQRGRAVGVILSGAGSDGALGVREIKAAGGMVLVQTPESAQTDGMPRSAIATGVADYIVPIEKMPAIISDYVVHSYVNKNSDAAHSENEPDHLAAIVGLIRARIKYDFSGYKKGTLMRRVRRRMSLRQLHDISNYVELLRQEKDEINALYKDLLIGVTSFFREPAAWEALTRAVIEPMVNECNHDASIRVWVPGCATGEEAYTIAMLFHEQLLAAEKRCRINVFASDIDQDALSFARIGIYPENITADVSSKRLKNFFNRVSDGYRIQKDIRETVVFAEQNVISDPPFSKLDLVSCRNLLIYLEANVQKRLMAMFHFAIKQNGFLFLGGSETISHEHDLFAPLLRKWRVYRRMSTVRQDSLERHFRTVDAAGGQLEVNSEEAPTAPNRRLVTQWQQMMLQRFVPACALINRKAEAVFFHGPIDNYLQLPSGELAPDIAEMARPGLRTKLRFAVHKAIREDKKVEIDDCQVKRGGQSVAVRIAVEPLRAPTEGAGLFLVTFEDGDGRGNGSTQPPVKARSSAVAADSEGDFETIVRNLENELRSTREDLQNCIEEIETSNEEFKAANEEVTSINEELQSTNEELETSKEELQSLNEELQTVNHQLGQKIGELEMTNNDLANLLSSTDVATTFLDRTFRLKRFTPAMKRLLRVIDTDIGRPITDLAGDINNEELLRDAEQVLHRLVPIESEMRDSRGKWFLRRVLPYRTEDDRIDGIVITFSDITLRKQDEQALQTLNEQLEVRVLERAAEANALVENAPDSLVILSGEGTILRANRQAESTFGYDREMLMGQSADILIPESARKLQATSFVGYLEELREHPAGFGCETTCVRRSGDEFPVDIQFNGLELNGETVVVAAVRDVTERHRLRMNEANLSALVKMSSVAVISIRKDGIIDNWNNGAEVLLGYREKEVTDRDIAIILAPNRAGQIHRLIGHMKEDHAVEHIDSVMIHKDGAQIDVALTLSRADNPSGNRSDIVIIARDVRERKRLEQQLAKIAEDERRRIGRELHDSVSQQVTALGLLASALRATLPENSPSAELAAKLESNLQDTKQQVRQLTKGILPVDVDAEGLQAALEQLSTEIRTTYGIDCKFECADRVAVDNNFFATQLFLVASEAVHNALKHAMPKQITVRLKSSDDLGVQLTVTDDGIGIDLQKSTSGMGMHIMRYRCELMGGTFAVTPIETGGTCITCQLLNLASRREQ